MKMRVGIFWVLLLANCTPRKSAESALDVVAYKLEIERWHQKRLQELLGPQGWLNVAGLFWLHDGINTFGSDPKNDVAFPEGKIAERAGYFKLKNGIVMVDIPIGISITIKGKPVSHITMFHPDSTKNPTLSFDSLQWFIIKRDTKYGVRLRDFTNEELRTFKGIERYEVDPALRLTARFEKTGGRTILITNILGQTTPQPSPGTLVFNLDGKEFRIDAIDEGDEDLFIIFGDASNAKETYGAGRYLYVKRPDTSGKTVIDFNKAYNPPCAFTAFATCPLPPKQNVLPVSIKAGEKNHAVH